MGTGELLGNQKNCGGVTCDGLYCSILYRGSIEILLAASGYKNWDNLRQLRARLAPLLLMPNDVNHVDAHFEVFSKCIAMKSNQGSSLIKIVSIANANAHCSHWLPLHPGEGGGGDSIYPWVGRCGPTPHTLTLFKTNITDFPTLFKTELRFLIPCLRHLKLWLQEEVWLSCGSSWKFNVPGINVKVNGSQYIYFFY